MIYQTTVKQAMTLSFVDAFWLLAVIILVLMPIVFIMRRPPRHGPVIEVD